MRGLQVLLLEDDDTVARAHARTVTRCGAVPHHRSTESSAHHAIGLMKFHAAVVDLRLTHDGAAELLRALEARGGRIPMLLHANLREPTVRNLPSPSREAELECGSSVQRRVELVVEEAFWRHWLGERAVLVAAASKVASDLALSPRERQVLVLALRGQSREQMAESLDVGVNSVRTYASLLREKAGKQRLAEVVAMVLDELGPGPRRDG